MPKPGKPTKRLGAILASNTGPLAGTLAHAANLQRLQPLVLQALPRDVADHCQPGNLRGDTLVIHADSPAWAAKLRFHAPQLVRRLQRLGGLSVLKRCEVRVLPVSKTRDSERPTASGISAQTREQLRQTAKDFRNPRLKQALTRLADGKSPVKKSLP